MATILLTDPFNLPAVDGFPAEVNGEVAISHYGIQSLPRSLRGIMVMVEYGNTVNGEWVRSRHESPTIHVQDQIQVLDGRGNELKAEDLVYSTLLASMKTLATDEAQPGDGGHNVAVGLERSALEWLIANKYPGTIQA